MWGWKQQGETGRDREKEREQKVVGDEKERIFTKKEMVKQRQRI